MINCGNDYQTSQDYRDELFTPVKPDVNEAELERIRAMICDVLRESNAGDEDKRPQVVTKAGS